MTVVQWRWTREDEPTNDVADECCWDDLPLEGDWKGDVSDGLPWQIMDAITRGLDEIQSETGEYDAGLVRVWIAAVVEGAVARKWAVELFLEYVPIFTTTKVEVVP